MTLLDACRSAIFSDESSPLRRSIAIRTLIATGIFEGEAGESWSVSRPTLTALLSASELAETRPETLLAAAAPILRALASSNGYEHLAVFGSGARREAHAGSDVDLLVQPPVGTSMFDFLRFKCLLEHVLGRDIDLVTYGGLNPGVDADVLRDATLL